jgi:hypothetical protein
MGNKPIPPPPPDDLIHKFVNNFNQPCDRFIRYSDDSPVTLTPSKVTTEHTLPIEVCLMIFQWCPHTWLRVSRTWQTLAHRKIISYYTKPTFRETLYVDLVERTSLDLFRYYLCLYECMDWITWSVLLKFTFGDGFSSEDGLFSVLLTQTFNMYMDDWDRTQDFIDDEMIELSLSRGLYYRTILLGRVSRDKTIWMDAIYTHAPDIPTGPLLMLIKCWVDEFQLPTHTKEGGYNDIFSRILCMNRSSRPYDLDPVIEYLFKNLKCRMSQPMIFSVLWEDDIKMIRHMFLKNPGDLDKLTDTILRKVNEGGLWPIFYKIEHLPWVARHPLTPIIRSRIDNYKPPPSRRNDPNHGLPFERRPHNLPGLANSENK